jgi:hypothetical protein
MGAKWVVKMNNLSFPLVGPFTKRPFHQATHNNLTK